MSFPAYEQYRDSGVEWLGEVPSHWEIAQLRHLLQIHNGADYKQVEADEGYPVIGSGGVFACASNYMHDGEALLLGRKGTIDQPIHFNGRFWAVDTMYWSKIRPGVSGRFSYYSACSMPFRYYSTSTALPSMTQGALNGHRLCLPPLSEQLAIAAFLDRETAKIDALVEEQRRLIELLKEKRQAVISHAVTKGLDPTVPMKDSGVEWLGEVPAHWEVVPARRLVGKMEQGWSPQCEARPAQAPDEWGVLKVGCVNGGVFAPDENKALPPELDAPAELRIHANDLLVSRANTRELVGSAAVVDRDYPNLLLCDKLYRLTFGDGRCDPRWAGKYMSSRHARGQFELAATGASSSMVNISQAVILDMPLALPPMHEQASILKWLNADLERLAALEYGSLSAIALLQERRAALISAAVTGKIDVRGLVPAEAEAA